MARSGICSRSKSGEKGRHLGQMEGDTVAGSHSFDGVERQREKEEEKQKGGLRHCKTMGEHELVPAAKKRTSFSGVGVGGGGGSSQCSTPTKRSSLSEGGTSGHHQYALFRTRSAKQLSRLREQQQEEQKQDPGGGGGGDATSTSSSSGGDDPVGPTPSARRYFAALRGPELEELHESEDALLPLDRKWPFLLRFPISAFGITLGLGSQAILWKNLASTPSLHFFPAPSSISFVLWIVAAIALAAIVVTYVLKIALFLEAVKREFHHPVRANFFFAPWIAAMFLALSAPDSARWLKPKPATWCVLMAPIFLLELKIYGQWLSGGERRLSRIANPSTHLSVVGNFVGAVLGAKVGWTEPAFFFWSIGLAHYLVVFVTLYQRLPTNESLPQELHPVFFLFIAAPSAASVAWESITGKFDHVSRLVYFIALFLFSSLVVRLNLFRGFKFSLAWWAYTFPTTALSIATIRYSQTVTNAGTQALALVLSCASSLTVFVLFVSTMCHLVFWKTLFPNDVAIAITYQKKKKRRKSRSCKSSCSSGSSSGSSSKISDKHFGRDKGSRIIGTTPFSFCFGSELEPVVSGEESGDEMCTKRQSDNDPKGSRSRSSMFGFCFGSELEPVTEEESGDDQTQSDRICDKV